MNIINKDRIDNTFDWLCPLLALGIPLGYSNALLVLGLLVVRLFTIDHKTSAFFLCIYGGVLGGVIRGAFPLIPIYGLVLNAIGIFLLRKEITNIFKYNGKGLLFSIMVLLLFVLFYFLGPRTPVASDKIISIITNGLFLLIAYTYFATGEKFEINGLTHLLIITSVFYIVASQIILPMEHPSSIVDFSWYRTSTEILKDEDIGRVSYHVVGMNALYAMGFYLSSTKERRLISMVPVIFAGIYMIMFSGARQAIFGFIVIFVISYFIKKSFKSHNVNISALVFAGLLGYLLLVILKSLDIDFINTVIGDSPSTTVAEKLNRSENFISAISLISNNLFTGVGIGGYQYYTGYPYPHNFILEILCECGLVGFIILFLITLRYIKLRSINLKFQVANGSIFIIPYLCFWIRSLISGSFTESIVIFIALFSISSSKLFKFNGAYSNNTSS